MALTTRMLQRDSLATKARRPVLAHIGMSRRARLVMPAIVAMTFLLASCAHKPVPPYDDTHPRSVAIIPVMPSETITLDRHSLIAPFFGVVGMAIERGDRMAKQQAFEVLFEPSRTDVADELTRALLAAAKRRGFEATVLSDIERTPDAPEDFEYPQIKTAADCIVHVRVKDMGVFNKTLDSDYMTQLDLAVVLAVHRSGEELLNENFHYGVNASRKEFWAVESDARYRFADFDAVLSDSKLVRESWRVGARLLAERIVEQLPPPPPR